MECGHGGLCYACGLELARKGQPCPLCRGVISEVLQLESTSAGSGVARSYNQATVLHRAEKRGHRRGASPRRGIGI
jgi:hypothetical protein